MRAEPEQRAARVFILEDSSYRIEGFRQAFAGAHVTIASSYDEAVAAFNPPYDLLCLDHDLGDLETSNPDIENTGYDFVLWLPRVSAEFEPKVVVHSHSKLDAAAMSRELIVKGFTPSLMPFDEKLLKKLRWLDGIQHAS